MVEFELSDFDAFDGHAKYNNLKIQKVQHKLKMLKIPLHRKFKDKYEIDFNEML